MSTDLTTTRVISSDYEGLFGRCFLHPVLDYLLIGGGLSLLVITYVLWNPGITPTDQLTTVLVFLMLNYAHFAASAVRLYSKPGCKETFRFLCYGFPVVGLAVLSLAIIWPEAIGKHLWALFLTWSPYHYAAQTYGLAVLYCYKSGCRLQTGEKRALWWICMLPFFRAFLDAPESGLAWFVPHTFIDSVPLLFHVHDVLIQCMTLLIFLLPVWLYLKMPTRMPMISFLLLITNGMWWVTLSYTGAWFWATIFHSIQYLAFIMIFHVKDRMAAKENRRGPVYHTLMFYTMCWLLGYCLFLGLPAAYSIVGLGGTETALLVAAAISIHHFIVDGYIWKSKKKPAPREA